MNRVGDLEVDQDLAYQRRVWTAQRVGWLMMALLLAAALLGLFGSGPLSKATIGEPGAPLRLEYARFARSRAPMTLTAHLGPGAVNADEAQVWLSRDYLNDVQVERVTPEPERVEAAVDRLVYVFRVTGPVSALSVSFDARPVRSGRRSGHAGAGNAQALRFEYFVYP